MSSQNFSWNGFDSQTSGWQSDCDTVTFLWEKYFRGEDNMDYSDPQTECCQIPGVVCEQGTQGDVQVVSIDWYNKRRTFIENTIPAAFGDLSNLRYLDLSFNGFEGEIPSELWNLRLLDTLKLHHNDISGQISDHIGGMSNLRVLMLDNNRLSGPIPPEIGELKKLHTLQLSGNGLEGQIPPELGELERLKYLIMGTNKLTGQIPSALGKLRNIMHMDISNNKLSGRVPEEFGHLWDLRTLNINGNTINGGIPLNIMNMVLFNNRNNAFFKRPRPSGSQVEDRKRQKGEDIDKDKQFISSSRAVSDASAVSSLYQSYREAMANYGKRPSIQDSVAANLKELRFMPGEKR